MTQTYPYVSVIILNFNGAQHLPTCIESLQSQTVADQIEIMVADNASTDDSKQVVQPYGVTFSELGANHGFGKGNNLGMRVAGGKYLFFVNNDMRFEPDCIEQMVQILESDETIFSVDARQYSWDGEYLLHARTVFRPASFWWFQYPYMRIDPAVESDVPMDVPMSSGATFMARRSMFDALGGFDETFFIDFEDLDLCWRAWLRGWRSVHVPGAIVYHKVGGGFRDKNERRRERRSHWRLFRQYSYMKNQVRFGMKVMPLRDNVNIFLRQHLFALYFLVKGKPYLAPYYMRAWWKTLLEVPEIWSARREAFRHAVTSSRVIRQRFLIDGSAVDSEGTTHGYCEVKTRWTDGVR